MEKFQLVWHGMKRECAWVMPEGLRTVWEYQRVVVRDRKGDHHKTRKPGESIEKTNRELKTKRQKCLPRTHITLKCPVHPLDPITLRRILDKPTIPHIVQVKREVAGSGIRRPWCSSLPLPLRALALGVAFLGGGGVGVGRSRRGVQSLIARLTRQHRLLLLWGVRGRAIATDTR